MFPFICLRSHKPPSISQQCLTNALWSPQNQCPAPLLMSLFISFYSQLCVCMITFCVLSLFYDPKYDPRRRAGLWSCCRLGLNSSQHASVFHVHSKVLRPTATGVDVRFMENACTAGSLWFYYMTLFIFHCT